MTEDKSLEERFNDHERFCRWRWWGITGGLAALCVALAFRLLDKS